MTHIYTHARSKIESKEVPRPSGPSNSGILGKILDRNQAIDSPTPTLCSKCRAGYLWLDLASQFHCMECDPPNSKYLVRSLWLATKSGESLCWRQLDWVQRLDERKTGLRPGCQSGGDEANQGDDETKWVFDETANTITRPGFTDCPRRGQAFEDWWQSLRPAEPTNFDRDFYLRNWHPAAIRNRGTSTSRKGKSHGKEKSGKQERLG